MPYALSLWNMPVVLCLTNHLFSSGLSCSSNCLQFSSFCLSYCSLSYLCNPLLLLPQLPLQLGWAGEMQALLASDELAKDVEGAEALLEQHEERKQEVRNKQEK